MRRPSAHRTQAVNGYQGSLFDALPEEPQEVIEREAPLFFDNEGEDRQELLTVSREEPPEIARFIDVLCEVISSVAAKRNGVGSEAEK